MKPIAVFGQCDICNSYFYSEWQRNKNGSWHRSKLCYDCVDKLERNAKKSA
jgi:hypothetical protein